MRIALILASLSFLVSCASLNLGGEAAPTENGDTASLDGMNLPEGSAPAQAPTESSSYASTESSETPVAAIQPEVINEQRSESEIDAAAPETSTDTFHASTQTPGIEEAPPTQLPEKTGASWDKQASALPVYEETKQEKAYNSHKAKKSSKISKKSSKQHGKLAKKDKKSKKDIAKNSKKSKKSLAKKSKVDCKKVAKLSKKAKKSEVAMCKIEKKKMAQKSKKMGKVASAGRNSSLR